MLLLFEAKREIVHTLLIYLARYLSNASLILFEKLEILIGLPPNDLADYLDIISILNITPIF
jgi:hypothetical protein